MKRQYYLLLAFVLPSLAGTAQTSWNFVGGIGFPEILYLGARKEFTQVQIGLNAGIFPDTTETPTASGSLDLYYHFAGTPQFDERMPWYARAGVSYLRLSDDYSIDHHMFCNLRVGREFYIYENVGFAADVGPGMRVVKVRNILQDCIGEDCRSGGNSFMNVVFSLYIFAFIM